jgi:hypothetical protein
MLNFLAALHFFLLAELSSPIGLLKHPGKKFSLSTFTFACLELIPIRIWQNDKMMRILPDPDPNPQH